MADMAPTTGRYREIAGVQTYIDPEATDLGAEFNLDSFRSVRSSQYGDNTIEQQVGPLAAYSAEAGRVVGLSLDGLNQAIRSMGGIFPVRDLDRLPDVRVEEISDLVVVFPTATLLEKFGIEKVDTSQ